MTEVEIVVDEHPERTSADVVIAASARGSSGGSVEGEAEARFAGGRWSILGPTTGTDPPMAGRLLEELVGACRNRSEAPIEWWVDEADSTSDALASQVGLQCTRELLQMRRALPVAEGAEIATRAFVPGQDDQTWLDVNNAAFHWHEDQANWSMAMLRQRMDEPWFDPAGFLLHERDGRLAGFCWTKDHRPLVPPLGEIYVIAVHPDFHGLGLGRALTLAGLAHLAGRGLPTAMLYVEAENAPAVGLYRDLGFEVHHRERRYTSPDHPVVSTPKSVPTP